MMDFYFVGPFGLSVYVWKAGHGVGLEGHEGGEGKGEGEGELEGCVAV